jgi:hypothetical protein
MALPSASTPWLIDLAAVLSDVRCWQILLKESFPADERNFSRPLMRFACRDVRDHDTFRKNDHGPLYRSSRALQRQKRPNIGFREILGAPQFSTFSTVSADRRHRWFGLK